MNRVDSGDGHLLIVEEVSYRGPTDPLAVPLPVLFVQTEAYGLLDADDRDGRLTPGAFEFGAGASEPDVGPEAFSADQRGMGATFVERVPSFVLGVHAEWLGSGRPYRLDSMIGMRPLPVGSYLDVPVPVWRRNPFPIAEPTAPGGRPRPRWAAVDLAPDREPTADVDLFVTLWHGFGADEEPPSPILDEDGIAEIHGETVTTRDEPTRDRDEFRRPTTG